MAAARALPVRKPAVIVASVLWISSGVLYSPSLWVLLAPGGMSLSRIPDYLAMCADPLTRALNEPILAYRITTPLLAWVLNLPVWACLALPHLFSIAALACVLRAVRRMTDERNAILLCAAIAFSYALIWSNTKPGVPDGVTHWAVSVCFLSISPVLAAITTIVGAMNDERFVLSIPFLLLWHAWSVSTIGEAWQKVRGMVAGFVGGLAVVLVLRHALTVGWIGTGISIPRTYTNWVAFRTNFALWLRESGVTYFANVAVSWRWLWVVWLAGIWMAWRSGPRWWAVLLAASMFCGCLLSSLVADVSRSIGFFYPAALCAWLALERYSPELGRRLLFWAVLLCALTPAFYLADQRTVQWARPLPLSLLRYWTGWDVLNLLH